MKYVVHRRFKSDSALCGHVNLPAFTECDNINGCIYYGGKPICYYGSENCRQYFAINEDGKGMLRGKYTQNIMKELRDRDEEYQDRWDKVWDDKICQKYKLKDYDDVWCWDDSFFDGDVDDLKYIAKLVGAKEEV